MVEWMILDLDTLKKIKIEDKKAVIYIKDDVIVVVDYFTSDFKMFFLLYGDVSILFSLNKKYSYNRFYDIVCRGHCIGSVFSFFPYLNDIYISELNLLFDTIKNHMKRHDNLKYLINTHIK